MKRKPYGKRLGIIGLLAAVIGSAQAEPVAVDLKGNTFFLPLQVVSAVQLYSPDLGKGFPAVETVLVQRKNWRVSAGAAPVLGSSQNVPFASLSTRLSPRFFDIGDNDLYFGAWTGKPSDSKSWTWGILASVALW